jgi:hypothetical protein
MHRLRRLTFAAALGLAAAAAAPAALAGPEHRSIPKPRKAMAVSAEHRKALAKLTGGYKFGMTRDEVIAVFSKQLDEEYDERIKATTDIPTQDRLRRDKKNEVNRLQQSYISFDDGKPSPWDVSIVDAEFAHNTGEAMLERWEKQGGLNQRRFFFFFDGKLWKMFISLDLSILPEDERNFAAFEEKMERAYGPGEVESNRIIWRTADIEARAIDKLKSYGMLAVVIEDSSVRRQVDATREAKAPPRHEGNGVIRAVIDKDNTDHPNVKANSDTIDTVIRAQGGDAPPPKSR